MTRPSDPVALDAPDGNTRKIWLLGILFWMLLASPLLGLVWLLSPT